MSNSDVATILSDHKFYGCGFWRPTLHESAMFAGSKENSDHFPTKLIENSLGHAVATALVAAQTLAAETWAQDGEPAERPTFQEALAVIGSDMRIAKLAIEFR